MANAGGEVERWSAIVEIPEESVPRIVKEYFANMARSKPGGPYCYESLSISVLDEQKGAL